jgi:shikimate 5-dehydrogenase
MPDLLSGATRLFPVIGDPISSVESPMRLTRTFGARGYNGMCVPMQVPAMTSTSSWRVSRPRGTWTGRGYST